MPTRIIPTNSIRAILAYWLKCTCSCQSRVTASLALAEELQAGTIEKVLAKDDVELALEFLLGKRKP
jgi:hypothetical protein